jgi:hypothetical protein
LPISGLIFCSYYFDTSEWTLFKQKYTLFGDIIGLITGYVTNAKMLQVSKKAKVILWSILFTKLGRRAETTLSSHAK